MQDFSIFDLIIIAITIILGLKGLFRGFIKEVFGIIGIVGAIFVASRISQETGELLAHVLNLENSATIKLIGFIVALIAVWLVVYSAGVVISKIFSASGLGAIDRILGFVFGALKIFLIFSVIAYALYQVQSFKKVIDEKFENSAVMPHLLSVGSYIIKLDTTAIIDTIDKGVQSVKENDTLKEAVSETKEQIGTTTEDIKQNIQEEVIQNFEDKVKDVTKDFAKKYEETTNNEENKEVKE